MVGQRFQPGAWDHCGQGRHELLLTDKFQTFGTITLIFSQASFSLAQAEQGSLIVVFQGLHLAVGIVGPDCQPVGNWMSTVGLCSAKNTSMEICFTCVVEFV